MSYEGVQLTEQLDATPATPRRGKWVRLGVASMLAVAGFTGVGVRVVNSWKPASKWSTRWNAAHKELLKAFASRKLLDDVSVEGTESYTWKKDGDPDPSKMGMTATFQKGNSKSESLALRLTLNAAKDQGEALSAKLQELWDSVTESADESMGKLVISTEGDTSVLVLHPNATDSDDVKIVEEDMQNVEPGHAEFGASIHFGRTFEEMWESRKEKFELAVGGMKVTAHFKLASAVFSKLEEVGMVQQYVPPPAEKALEEIKTMDLTSETIYKADAKFEQSPSLEESLGMAVGMMVEPLGEHKGTLQDLNKLIAGPKKLEFLGFPEMWELVVDFTGVHVTPVITAILEESEKEEENEEK